MRADGAVRGINAAESADVPPENQALRYAGQRPPEPGVPGPWTREGADVEDHRAVVEVLDDEAFFTDLGMPRERAIGEPAPVCLTDHVYDAAGREQLKGPHAGRQDDHCARSRDGRPGRDAQPG